MKTVRQDEKYKGQKFTLQITVTRKTAKYPLETGTLHIKLLKFNIWRFRIKLKGRIRIRIKVVSWIGIRMKVTSWIRIGINLQMKSQNVEIWAYKGIFSRFLTFILEPRIGGIRIWIKVTSRIRIHIKVMRIRNTVLKPKILSPFLHLLLALALQLWRCPVSQSCLAWVLPL